MEPGWIVVALRNGGTIADTVKDIGGGASPADAIVGNVVRGGLVYGASTQGILGIPAAIALHRFLPCGAAMGHAILSDPMPADGLTNTYPFDPH